MMKSNKKLIFLCYTGFVAVSFFICLFNFAQDRVLRMQGKLSPIEYTIKDFKLVDLQIVNDHTLISTSADPRMILKNAPSVLHRIDFDVEYSITPGEFTLFYMKQANMEEFSANNRVWAQKKSETQYTFRLPRVRCYGLRVDPGMYAGNIIEFHSIIANAKQPALSFFAISYTWLFYFFVAPALIASVLKYGYALVSTALRREFKIIGGNRNGN